MIDFFSFLRPQNLGQVKALFEQFGHFLSPENYNMVAAVIREAEKGEGHMDVGFLQEAAREISGQVGGAVPAVIPPDGYIKD
ncbi:MAG: hypothetical protein FWE85_01070 [Clostridiales bacterium]|nr:hypothetical protein [Clostridiales bacterium]